MSPNSPKLSWWVPFSLHAAQARREQRDLFPPAALARIGLALMALLGGLAWMLARWFPLFEFNWGSALAKCLLGLLGFLVAGLIRLHIPPHVTVSSRGILISQDLSSRLYRYSDLAELRLEPAGPAHARLVLRLHAEQKVRHIPISPQVSLKELHTLIESCRPGLLA